ncbi:hypothetical protein [Parapedobacter koreensis]|uniref:Uncharacterized protein n=1 Tax=Parapedobacter koreensis TaxID=332977 RepID=A0A1H7FJC6_9SPHI|nr:hypothetical protein [Parapedobacter koreensis]SEK24542.1 hypothetical protein SAMN05421740_101328 [Parapedobacter koreensis]
MNRHSGTLDFDYLGQRKTIPYSYFENGGQANVHLTDKKGCCHAYFYDERRNVWVGLGKQPKWPADFVYTLHRMLDTVLEKAKIQ